MFTSCGFKSPTCSCIRQLCEGCRLQPRAGFIHSNLHLAFPTVEMISQHMEWEMQLGLNGFADWTPEEFEAAYFGGAKGRPSAPAVVRYIPISAVLPSFTVSLSLFLSHRLSVSVSLPLCVAVYVCVCVCVCVCACVRFAPSLFLSLCLLPSLSPFPPLSLSPVCVSLCMCVRPCTSVSVQRKGFPCTAVWV
jgi:hypothetical protein